MHQFAEYCYLRADTTPLELGFRELLQPRADNTHPEKVIATNIESTDSALHACLIL